MPGADEHVPTESLDEVAESIDNVVDSAKESINAMGASKFVEVLKTSKGSRPDPSSYLPESYIDNHLAKFDDGASRFMPKSNLDTYGPGQKDGTSFVLPKSKADELIAKAGGDKRLLEDSLGLPSGFLDTEQLVRVDIPNPIKFNPRVPSGNEAGANAQWLPGGKLPNGNSEAVLDLGNVKSGPDTWTSSKVDF